MGIKHSNKSNSNPTVSKIQDVLVKIADFGISLNQEENANNFRGTMLYSAPESLTDKQFDRRSDIWSIGVCL